ncbi:lipid asymmetry maintenance protein MlaB [Alteromonas sp. AMM-1]|uniref:STAS domain-containing protein n=1 Tax=Alteromonas sp. AMM-1 TaxID=3394233 RepID=UPI0039A77692
MSTVSVIALNGALDRQSLTKDWWALLSNADKQSYRQAGACTFDFSQVERVDSAGLAWTINAIRDGRAQGIKITLCNLPEKMLKLAKISEIDAFLPVQNATLSQ